VPRTVEVGVRRGLSLLAVLLASAAYCAQSVAARSVKHTWVLQPGYRMKTIAEGFDPSRCLVYENFSHAGDTWTVAPGQLIAWRYNRTPTISVIIDSRHGPVHWGFIDRSCIGVSTGNRSPEPTHPERGWPAHIPVPTMGRPGLMNYRSQSAPHWKPVRWQTSPARRANATITRQELLRNEPNGVGLGTLHDKWHVYRSHTTGRGYVKVYSSTLRLWGWVQTNAVRSIHHRTSVLTAGHTYMYCPGNRQTSSRPNHCDTLKPAEPLAFGLNLDGIHWKTWGGATALATGVERGYHLPPDNTQVTIRASHRSACLINHARDKVYFYTELTATSRFGSRTDNIPPPCD
jgi:hypothetical protein